MKHEDTKQIIIERNTYQLFGVQTGITEFDNQRNVWTEVTSGTTMDLNSWLKQGWKIVSMKSSVSVATTQYDSVIRTTLTSILLEKI